MSDLFAEPDTETAPEASAQGDGAPSEPPVDIAPGTFQRVPADATEAGLQALERAFARVEKNRRIRRDYEALKDESGRFPNGFRAAREKIAEKHAVSEARVRRAVSGA